MDLALNETQLAIEASCARLFEGAAGPARARHLRETNGFDEALLTEMGEGGFLDLFHDDSALTAALVTEWAAQACALAPVGHRMLTGPSVIEGPLPAIIAVAEAGSLKAVRFGAEADLLILIKGPEARVARRGEFTATPARSKFGYPIAAISDVVGTPLPSGSGDIARRWWRIALSAEIAGTARAALELTVRYLRDRSQFGRKIAQFQAVQHRLATLHVLVDAARWTMREAAWHGAPGHLATSAAINASEAGASAFYETHQLTGAMGFTLEYDLHLWTMRLQTLRHELQGMRAHARDLVAAQWPISPGAR